MQEEPRNSSFSTPACVRGLDQVRLDHQIVVEELGRVACRWRGCRRPWRRRRNTACGPLAPPSSASTSAWRVQIELGPRSRSGARSLLGASRRTSADADHAAMAGDPDPLAWQSVRSSGSSIAAWQRSASAPSSRARVSAGLRDRLATISLTSSANAVVCVQPSSRVRLAGIAQQ